MRSLRRIYKEDLDKIIRLKIESWQEELAGKLVDEIDYNESMDFWSNWMIRGEENNDHRLLIGMFEDETLIGASIVSYAERHDIESGGIELNGLWVDKGYRFQGVSLQMLRYIVEYYRDIDQNIKRMVAYCHHYAPSRDFYEKLGAKLLRQDQQMEGRLLVDVLLIDFEAIMAKEVKGKPYIIHSPVAKDLEIVEESMERYNSSKAGKHLSKQFNLIIEDSGDVCGGCNGTIAWGWMFVDNLYVCESKRLKGIGTALLKKALDLALENNINQVSITTIYDNVYSYLLSKGFLLDGCIENRPNGYNYRFLSRTVSDTIDFEAKSYPILDLKGENPLVAKFFDLISQDKLRNVGEIPFEMLRIAYKNTRNETIGGLLGYIGWHWLYISDLWIEESDQGKGYAKNLMNYAEAYAKTKGVNGYFLGTTDFQAPDFYKKLGYKVFSTRENLPPGFKNYSMLKHPS